jgi:TrmH family RNA methyltransferase
MKTLTPTNAQIKLWGKLGTAKARRRENLFLAEGAKVVAEVFKGKWEATALLVMKGNENLQERLGRDTASKRVDTYLLTERQWRDLSQDKSPEGIMAVVKWRPHDDLPDLLQRTAGHALLLDRINNPNNLGALMRTALWFGIRLVLMSKGSVDFTNPKVVRASMGSLFHMTICDDLDFRKELADIKRHFVVIGSDVGRGVAPHPCRRRAALVFGNESHGLPADILATADETWHIPGTGDMESLSLPQAAAVMLYECTRNDWEGRTDGTFHPDRHHDR